MEDHQGPQEGPLEGHQGPQEDPSEVPWKGQLLVVQLEELQLVAVPWMQAVPSEDPLMGEVPLMVVGPSEDP